MLIPSAPFGTGRGLACHGRRRSFCGLPGRVRDRIFRFLSRVHSICSIAHFRGRDRISEQAAFPHVARVLGRELLFFERSIRFSDGFGDGNIVRGIPLGADQEYASSFWALFNPYSILVGIMVVALFMMHGAIYAVMKTEGALYEKLHLWVNRTIIFLSYAIRSLRWSRFFTSAHDRIDQGAPVFFVVAFLDMLAIANIPREIARGKDFRAFLSSCAAIVALMMLFGIGMYPNLVYSFPIPNTASPCTTRRLQGKPFGSC